MIEELKKQKLAVEGAWNALVQERTKLQQSLAQVNGQLLELQGQHKLVTELIDKATLKKEEKGKVKKEVDKKVKATEVKH